MVGTFGIVIDVVAMEKSQVLTDVPNTMCNVCKKISFTFVNKIER